jgi:hypothetical protein
MLFVLDVVLKQLSKLTEMIYDTPNMNNIQGIFSFLIFYKKYDIIYIENK